MDLLETMSPSVGAAIPSPREVCGRQSAGFADMVREQSRPLQRYVFSLTGVDRQLGEDIVQETLLRAWRSRACLFNFGESARPWLRTVALNILRDCRRAEKSRPVLVNDDAVLMTAPDGADAIDGALDAKVMREALARLSADHRAILVHVYYYGTGPVEAARVLGIPVGTAKSRCAHARRALRLVLMEMGLG
jgi:RNA polymerase sigma-70 factor (ECF subfamily)